MRECIDKDCMRAGSADAGSCAACQCVWLEQECEQLRAERDMLRDAVRKARLQVGVSYDSSGKVVAVSMGNMYPLAEILDAALKEDTPIS